MILATHRACLGNVSEKQDDNASCYQYTALAVGKAVHCATDLVVPSAHTDQLPRRFLLPLIQMAPSQLLCPLGLSCVPRLHHHLTLTKGSRTTPYGNETERWVGQLGTYRAEFRRQCRRSRIGQRLGFWSKVLLVVNLERTVSKSSSRGKTEGKTVRGERDAMIILLYKQPSSVPFTSMIASRPR